MRSLECTWLKKLRENEKLIKLYRLYLISGDNIKPSSQLKLIHEITRLSEQNKQIREMNLNELEKDCLNWLSKPIDSIINI